MTLWLGDRIKHRTTTMDKIPNRAYKKSVALPGTCPKIKQITTTTHTVLYNNTQFPETKLNETENAENVTKKIL